MHSWEVADPGEGRGANENKRLPSSSRRRSKETWLPKKGRSIYFMYVFLLLVIFCISYEIDMELNPEDIEDNGYIGLICIEYSSQHTVKLILCTVYQTHIL